MPKIKVTQSLENKDFWSWCSGDLKDKIFLIDNLDVLERNGLVYLYTDTYNNRKTLKTGIYKHLKDK